jgi:hypothetical protein
MLRPSVQPSSRSRDVKTETQRSAVDGEPAPRKPIVGRLAVCCARAANGRCSRAAEERDEFASFHRITS